MINELVPLIGKRLDSDEIRAIFTAWNVPIPKKTACTANNSSMGDCKLRKDGLSLQFGMGGHGELVKPIQIDKKGSRFEGICIFVCAQKGYEGAFPFDISIEMTAEELTKILGEPKEDDFMGIYTRTWRKDFEGDYEVLYIENIFDGKKREVQMRIQCKWDNALETLADYEKMGL
ncbi:MAG: hypothetical protein U5L45_18385 [Saprospiraceae bacterium]|nr:hypothetical protein [Saprospiraceae bacterium]